MATLVALGGRGPGLTPASAHGPRPRVRGGVNSVAHSEKQGRGLRAWSHDYTDVGVERARHELEKDSGTERDCDPPLTDRELTDSDRRPLALGPADQVSRAQPGAFPPGCSPLHV